MAASDTQAEERKPWLYAFAILLLVSAWMLTMRLMSNPFLALDFEVSLVYLPTALAGIIAFQTTRKQRELAHPPP
jgi:TRAP-type C4-dicarboxylate transport system permease small subunit